MGYTVNEKLFLVAKKDFNKVHYTMHNSNIDPEKCFLFSFKS